METQLQKGQEILLTIKRLGINGEGIGYYKRQAVFVDGAIPNEQVIVKINELNKGYAKGDLVGIKERAETRIKPFCPHFGTCGGCQLQHIVLNEQYRLKQEMLLQAIERYTDLDLTKIKVHPFDVDHQDRYYRHKAQMPVRNTKAGLMTGLYKKNSQDHVDVPACPVQDKRINEVNQAVLKLAHEHGVRALDTKTFQGLLRYLVTRVSSATGDIQVTLVVSIYNHALKTLAQDILALENVVSVAISKNHSIKNVGIFGDDFETLAGQPTIEESLGDIHYKLTPKAFFQLNPEVAKQMYDYLFTLLGEEDTTLLDLYTGSGAIALYVARHFQTVFGIDASDASILAAKDNAKDNGLEHVHFLLNDASEGMKALDQQGHRFTTAIFDPPRTGLDDKVLDRLIRQPIAKLIYVSCNPSTLAKDLKVLSRKYDVVSIKPFDMFPHTAHIESVTLLSLKTA